MRGPEGARFTSSVMVLLSAEGERIEPPVTRDAVFEPASVQDYVEVRRCDGHVRVGRVRVESRNDHEQGTDLAGLERPIRHFEIPVDPIARPQSERDRELVGARIVGVGGIVGTAAARRASHDDPTVRQGRRLNGPCSDRLVAVLTAQVLVVDVRDDRYHNPDDYREDQRHHDVHGAVTTHVTAELSLLRSGDTTGHLTRDFHRTSPIGV